MQVVLARGQVLLYFKIHGLARPIWRANMTHRDTEVGCPSRATRSPKTPHAERGSALDRSKTTQGQAPRWVQDRLDAEEAMGGAFESSHERTGWLIGTILGLAWRLLAWGLVFVAFSCVLYIIGRALLGGGS